jgi:methyl coenzyme M reductase alpha subunit
MTDPLSESKVAEAAQAAAVSHEAMVNAQAALLKESEARISILVGDKIRDAIEHAFFVPTVPGKQKKFIDITQIPRICDDIAAIKNTLWWQSRIAGVVGMIILTLLAAFISALQGVHL